MFGNHKYKRRQKIENLIADHYRARDLLNMVARDRDGFDQVHHDDLKRRAQEETNMIIYYGRLLREHNAGLDVTLPGESDW